MSSSSAPGGPTGGHSPHRLARALLTTIAVGAAAAAVNTLRKRREATSVAPPVSTPVAPPAAETPSVAETAAPVETPSVLAPVETAETAEPVEPAAAPADLAADSTTETPVVEPVETEEPVETPDALTDVPTGAPVDTEEPVEPPEIPWVFEAPEVATAATSGSRRGESWLDRHRRSLFALLAVLCVLVVVAAALYVLHERQDSKTSGGAATHTVKTDTGQSVSAGGPQTVLGPSGSIDSLYATVTDAQGNLHAFMSNDTTVWYDERPDGTLTNARIVMSDGPKGSLDYCGVHPVGAIYKVTKTHWVTFFHGEQADPHRDNGECYGQDRKRNDTRWSILRMQTFDAGETWQKGGQVITQDSKYLHWPSPTETKDRHLDDAGSPRLVIHGGYLYLFYRAANRASDGQLEMTVARAPESSLGVPGSWKKYFAPAGAKEGDFTQPGLGGQQTSIVGLPATARGITWNTYLKAYITATVNENGISFYRSFGPRLTERWRRLTKDPVVPGTNSPSAFGMPCTPANKPKMPKTIGYGATIGWDGSSTETGQQFWIYYMLKPKGECFNTRYLVRRAIAIDKSVPTYPKVEIVWETVFSGPQTSGSTVTSTLTRNGVPWEDHTVQVLSQGSSGWQDAGTATTDADGVLTFTATPGTTYKFHVKGKAPYSDTDSATFTVQ
ncbi:MAG TPA: hypothetical protein VF426_04890 [Marmoricola sp.]